MPGRERLERRIFVMIPRRGREASGSDRPLRVAQVCGTVDGGLWMVQIAVGLQRRGFEVIAIIGSDTGGTAAALRRAGVPFVAMAQPLSSSSRAAELIGRIPYLGILRVVVDSMGLIRRALLMARLLRRLDVDIVHSHLVNSMVLARLAAFIARVPIRVSMIAAPLHLESRWFRKLDTATYRLDDRILAGCQHTSDLYAAIGIPSSKLSTVGYGIDPHGFDPAAADGSRVRREFGISDDTPLIGQIAFFYRVLRPSVAPAGAQGRGIKGHEDLLAAARLLLDRRPDVRFLVVGDGFGEGGRQHFDDIRRMAADLGLGDSVIFPGRRRDLADVIAALDVSVQCSLSENYGGTIESLLMERPMIATRVGGMPEIVIDDETGLLVPVQCPEELAAAMLRLIDDPELGQRLGRAGRQRMLERHTIQRTTDLVVQVYKEVARAKGITRPPLGLLQPAAGALLDDGLGLMPRHVLFTDGV